MEEFVSATLFLLKGTLIELIQFLPNLGVKLRDRKELLIAQGGNNPCRYVANAAFGIRFVLLISNYR